MTQGRMLAFFGGQCNTQPQSDMLHRVAGSCTIGCESKLMAGIARSRALKARSGPNALELFTHIVV